MRRFCFGMVIMLLAAAARADDAAEQPILILNTGGHTAPITTVLFTPDGKEVVTTSQDMTVRRWDAGTGERLGVLRTPFALSTAALSPDGRTLAVAGNGGKSGPWILLIDLADMKVTAALKSGAKVTKLAYSHDGNRIAAGGSEGTVDLWDAASHQLLHTLEGHKHWINDIAFSPDDRMLATGSADKTARLWSVGTGKQAAGPLAHEDKVLCVAWRDNDTLATGGDGLTFIHLWDRAGKHLRHFDKLRAAPSFIISLTFLPNKNNKDKYIKDLFYTFADPGEGGAHRSGGAVLDLAGKAGSRDGYVWDNEGGSLGAVSPDGRLAATVGEDDNGVTLWGLGDGKPVRRLTGRGETPHRVGWSPQGGVVGWTNTLKRAAGAEDLLRRSFDLGGLHFGKKPDARYVLAVQTFGGLHLAFDGTNHLVKRNQEVVSTIKSGAWAQCWTWLPGDRVALSYYGYVKLYNGRTGELIRTFGYDGSGFVEDMALSPDGRYLLVVYQDKTLRIWDVNAQKPSLLLSLFGAGADWVAWTKEGYYAASPAGEKLMGWQVNNGPEQLATFYPAAQFHKAFYRPDVIRRVLAEGSVAKALEAADKESGATTQTLDVARALPPEVKILAPTTDDPMTADVEVKASAESKDRPVVSLRLLLDGRPFPGAEVKQFPAAKAGEKQQAAWAVKKPEGDHVLSVLADSDVSSAASADFKVAYRPQAQEPLPTLYVLAIGINKYPGSLKLNWAVDDATAVQKAFGAGAPAPFGKVEPKLLLDEQATRQGILDGLDWLKAMKPEDTAVVFYAGHGHRDRKTSQFYMLPVDVDVTNLPDTGVTGTQLKEKFKAMSGRVLVLLDACHSGSIGQSPADSNTDDVQRQLSAPDCGVVIMCAAMAQEEAGEAAAVQHGFFTAALLKGLGGEAPPDRKDGFIHLTGLNYYVEQEVAELSKDEQHVVVDRPSTVTSFPLVKSGAKAEEK